MGVIFSFHKQTFQAVAEVTVCPVRTDIIIGAAYFAIPVVIVKYVSKKQHAGFYKLYFLFAGLILACGSTHLLDATAFWFPVYRLNALFRFITAVISCLTVYHFMGHLPQLFSLKSKESLQLEIEKQKKAEEELFLLNATLEKRVQERTAELLDTLREVSAYKYALDESSIVAITNQKGIITHVNENFCRISRYSREELLGQDHRIVNSGYHTKEFIRVLWKTIANGKIWKGELKNRAKDGSYYWVDTTIVPFLNEEGKPYQYVAIRADITERKKAEDDLSNSLKEITAYKYALDESSIVAITNQKGIISHVNENFCRISRYSREELLGQDHRIINSGNHTKEFIRDLWKTIANGKIWKGELKNKAKDGSYYWVDTTIVPFLNEEGKPYQYVAIRADITERKLAEDKVLALNSTLKKSEKQFRAMIENSKDVFIVSSESGVTFVSHGIEAMLGYTEEEFARMSPEQMAHGDNFPLRWEELEKPGDMIQLEFRCQHKNDGWRWLEGTGVNLTDVDGLNGIVFTLRDITERKDSEKRLIESERIYKTIASSIPGSFICLIDKNYRYILAEGDMLEKTGYSPSLLLGRRAQEIFPKTQYDEFLLNIERVFSGEYFIIETNRSGFDLITRYVPLKNDDGEVYLVMLVGIDISELKNIQREIVDLNSVLEQKVEARTAQLEIANKELEAFSYSISHDLRAPLRAISGFAKILEEDHETLLNESAKRQLGIIHQNVKQMGTLIDNLLEFSRLGRKEVQKSRVDMNTLVKSVITETVTTAQHNVEVKTGHLLPAFADGALIKQVLINFISNAFKYSSKKQKAQITIRSVIENDDIIYSVSDNGIGFDMQYQHKLFNVFERLHTSEEFEGTGVGLAIVKRIITKHNGKVWATGKKDEGATFYFSLPANFTGS